jgi:glycosyltransferase involved in cell wall biosynthesis
VRILYICHYFHPEIGAPSARALEMARKWVDFGHQVDVVTCFPNHPTGVVPAGYRGKLYQREVLSDGITVYRNYVYATPNHGFFRKTIGHLSFMVSSVVLSMYRVRRPDVIVVSSPTLFAVVSAYVFSRLRRVPYVFEVRDLWPAAIASLGVLDSSSWVVRALEKLELFLYHRAARVVTVTAAFRQDIASRGIDAAKIEVITNGADEALFHPRNGSGMRGELGLEGRFIVLYIGAHGISQALSAVMEVADRARASPKIHFLFVGEGAEKDELVATRDRLGLTNVTFLPGQPKEMVPSFYAAADVCLVPLRGVPLFRAFIPSKMFEIMASGRAIIGSVDGEARQILERSGAALVVQPEDVAQLLAAICRLQACPQMKQKMEDAGPPFVAAHYSRRALAEQYLDLLQEVCGGS